MDARRKSLDEQEGLQLSEVASGAKRFRAQPGTWQVERCLKRSDARNAAPPEGTEFDTMGGEMRTALRKRPRFSMRRIPSGSKTALLVGTLLSLVSGVVSAQEAATPEAASTPLVSEGVLALVGVDVVPMSRPGLLPDQTVLVRGDRIVEIGPASELVVPADAMVIDGRDRFLTPGLADMHVHLDEGLGNRADFGDAPLYLAHGVTTVLNLRGDATALEWRRRIESGEITAPSVYTAGEFLNEPYVTTAEEVVAEVVRQAEAGFDVVKFHEFYSVEERRYLTTVGLSREAYARMMKSARAVGIPVIGHAPHNLPFRTVLEEGMDLAHANAFLEHHFLPDGTASFRWAARVAKSGALAVLAVALVGLSAALLLQRRPSTTDVALTLAGCGVAISWLLIWEHTSWAGNDRLIGALFFCALAVVVVFSLALRSLWRSRDSGWRTRLHRTLSTLSLGAVAATFSYWLPLAWLNRERALDEMAWQVRESGISVITTLIVDSPAWFEAEHPERRYLTARTSWRDWSPPADSSSWFSLDRLAPDPLVSRWEVLLSRLMVRLRDAGVPLVLGTDAMGFPLIIPGVAVHEELALLSRAGLTPFEALQTATVRPAELLGLESDFGSVGVGKRADLLLLDDNPLEDLAALRRPAGVVLRGRRLSREVLDGMLEALSKGDSAPES